MEKIHVQFIIFKGELIAVFPYQIENKTSVLSYSHIGQHSGCIWNINQFSKLAKPQQYESLKKELESIGYNLEIIKKRNHQKYLDAYYKSIGF